MDTPKAFTFRPSNEAMDSIERWLKKNAPLEISRNTLLNLAIVEFCKSEYVLKPISDHDSKTDAATAATEAYLKRRTSKD